MFIRNLPSGGGGGVTPGGGSSGFTPTRIIVANAAGALDQTSAVYTIYDTSGDASLYFDQSAYVDPGGAFAYFECAIPSTAGQAGATFTISAGRGANGSGATPGGAGGTGTFVGGRGGNGTASAAAGAGAPLLLYAGTPGTNNGGGAGAGAGVDIQATSGTVNGDITVGTGNGGGYITRYIRLADASNGQIVFGASAPSGAEKFRASGTIAPAANAVGYLAQFDGTITEAGSGTHALLANVAVLTPTVTGGAATVTAAASFYVQGAPTGTFASYTAAAAIAPQTDALSIIGNMAMGAWIDAGGINIALYANRASTTAYLLRHASSATLINAPTAASLLYLTCGGGVSQGWRIGDGVGSAYHFAPLTNNAFDLGTNALRPRDVYIARDIEIDGVFNHDGTTFGALGAAPVVQQTSGANLTNNVTAGGVNDTIADYAIVDYATDAATIRNDIYQLARKVKQLNDGLRLFGFFT